MNTEANFKTNSMSVPLVKALAEIGGAIKDKINPAFKSKYADLGSVIDAIKPVLARHDLAFAQHTEPSEGGVIVETIVYSAGGSELSFGKLFVPANKNDAQGFGSALTYARRYSLMTAFGVPAEDDDGNAAARNPTADEPAIKPRVVLDGPYKSPSALTAAIKAFAESLRIFDDDLNGFSAWMATPEVVELEKQAMRDASELWETGEGLPEEFKPVAERIHIKKRELEIAEQTNILQAG